MWHLKANIQLLGTPKELPRITEKETQELSDALLESALCIVKRRMAGTGLDGELDVSCTIENR